MPNIAIISIYPFPDGMAPTNRIKAYAKGLVANECNVTIYIPFPTEQNPIVNVDKGNFQGIQYFHTSGKQKGKNKLIRGVSVLLYLRRMKGYLTSGFRLRKENKNKKIDILIISSDRISDLFFFTFLAKFMKAKCLFIFDEYPIPIRHKLKSRIPWIKEWLYGIVLKNIDGYISISTNLEQYFCKIRKKPTFILPVIIDTDRFDNVIVNRNCKREYLCYMGNMELSKDDVNNIIDAFGIIAQDFPDVDLYLYGTPNENAFVLLRDMVMKLEIENRVFFKGRVGYEQVPGILKNALILVSSQPETKRSSGGFPTKLGEYLATGVPSLFTNVGENAKYVQDEVHLYFVDPQSPIKYAEKIRFILNNYEDALRCAARGREYVLANSSHFEQGKKLKLFLETL